MKMNNEIKGILKILKECSIGACITKHDSKVLLYYITNLEQENKELKKNQRYYKNGVFSLEYDKETLSDMVDDYKSRVEKAVNNCNKSIKSINEKLENNKEPFEVIDGTLIYLNDYQVCRLKAIRMKCKELLNILQNGSDDNV